MLLIRAPYILSNNEEARWEAELNLRHLKTTLKMEILRGQTPEMVRKEIYVHLLAYNLLRTVMWSAGTQMGVNPKRLSLQEARHHLDNFVDELKNCGAKKRKKLYQTMLELIAHKPREKRAGRFEPRVKKRRTRILSTYDRTSLCSPAKSRLKTLFFPPFFSNPLPNSS